MDNDVIIIPSYGEVAEKSSLENAETSAEETLQNILPAHENFENPLTFNKNVFEYINSLPDLVSVTNAAAQISDLQIKEIFWYNFKKYLAEKNSLERRRAALKCAYINHYFGSLIPLSKNINRFKTPYHFYGIFISNGAKIGKGCTIFQHVTIGSNTLLDSKNAGFPVIGDNCYIGAGAKIIGNVTVGNNVRIGAGVTVTKDIPDNCTVAQAAPVIIQKANPQNNRWISYADYKKIKAEENAGQNLNVSPYRGGGVNVLIFFPHLQVRQKMCTV